jgi:hypothetical protein
MWVIQLYLPQLYFFMNQLHLEPFLGVLLSKSKIYRDVHRLFQLTVRIIREQRTKIIFVKS